MMDHDPCQEMRQAVDDALAAWERLKAAETDELESTDPSQRRSPPMGGDLGSRFYETIGSQEAASRRYRAAVRTLSECLRQNDKRPGIIASAHD